MKFDGFITRNNFEIFLKMNAAQPMPPSRLPTIDIVWKFTSKKPRQETCIYVNSSEACSLAKQDRPTV